MSHGRLLALLTSLLILAALGAGCGGDDESTVTVTTTTGTEQTEATASTDETTPTVTGDVTTEPAEPAIPPSTGAKRGPSAFKTPSGNIGCYIDVNAARCDISQRSWKPTPDSASCTLDYGQGIIVTHDHAEFVCAGDTTLGATATLPYGQSSERGKYVCESTEEGVTCAESENGHGFFISKESFRVF